MVYRNLASVYDFLMQDIDYKAWVDYLMLLTQQNGAPGKSLLDLGCGTGKISVLLAQEGFDVIGVDNSVEMLTEAEQKFRKSNRKANLYKQDIRELNIREKVDIVISTFDTFNYLLAEEDLARVFSNAYDVLNDKGLFIFDLNTYYYLKEILANNIFTYNTPELVYLWENDFSEEQFISQMNLTFFVQEEKDDRYRRFNEEHEQKAYKLDKVKELLTNSLFKEIKIYGKLSFSKPKSEEEKIFFIARK